MSQDLIQQHAPDLILPPQGQWVTPETQAGVTAPENLYDAQGNPLNYIQDAGGPRQFFVPGNTTPGLMPPEQPTATPVSGLRGRTSAAPLPIRGRTDPNAPTLDIPIIARRGPQAQPQAAPPQDILRGRTTPPQAPYTPPSASVAVPPPNQTPATPGLQNRVAQASIQNRQNSPEHMSRQIFNAGLDEHAMNRTINPEGSLGELLSGFNFDLSGLQQILAGRQNDPLRGRTRDPVPISQLPIVDPQADLPSRQPRVRRVTSNLLPDFSTAEGLAAFNQRTGMNLGRQLRTQEEQDSLYNRGLTPTRASRHIGGRAMDYPGRQLGGRTGAEAEQFVRDQWEAWGYSTEGVEFQYESGRGRNQGSGPHVHVEF